MRGRAALAAILGVWGAGCSLAFGVNGLTGGSPAASTADASMDAAPEAAPGNDGEAGESLDAASESAADAPQPDAMEAGTWCSTQGPHLLCADFDEGSTTAGWSRVDMSGMDGTLSLATDYVSAPASLSASNPASTGNDYSARLVEELLGVPKSAHLEFDMRIVGNPGPPAGSYLEFAKLEFDDPNPTGEGLDFGLTGGGPYFLINVLGADGGQTGSDNTFSGLAFGQWVHVAIDYVLDQSAGSVTVVLNHDTANPAIQLTNVQTLSSTMTTAARFKLGVWTGGTNAAVDVEYDDVIIDVK